jgi:hypothetical protein
MRQLDVLDISAREHRRIHDELGILLRGSRLPSVGSITRFASVLSHHEAADRFLLHPPLMRDAHGRRLTADRRAEQGLLASLLRDLVSAVGRAGDPARLVHQLRDLERVLVGHTDREELEDFPHLRRTTTPRERGHLARVRRQLQRRVAPPIEEVIVAGVRDPDAGIDPLREAEVVTRDALEAIGGLPGID